MQPWKIAKFRGGLAVVFNDNDGKRRRYSLTAKDKKNATPEAVEIVTEFFQVQPEHITIDDIWVAYSEHLSERPSAKRLKNTRALKEFFGKYRPSQISEDLVKKYILSRVNLVTGKKVGDETLWTELGILRSALNYAAKRRKMFSISDIPFIPRPSKPAPRDRPLSRDEIKRLLLAAKNVPHLCIAIHLMLGTAGRITAVLELTWDRVDFEKGTIDLRVNSSGSRKGRAKVPMNRGLRRALMEWHKTSDSDFVVAFNGSPVKSIKTAFNTAVKKANLIDVKQHDIRHTAAVWMLHSGSLIQKISQYLGHTSLDQTVKVYARYQPKFLEDESNSLDVSDIIFDEVYNESSDTLECYNITETEDNIFISIDKRAQKFSDLAGKRILTTVSESFQ